MGPSLPTEAEREQNRIRARAWRAAAAAGDEGKRLTIRLTAQRRRFERGPNTVTADDWRRILEAFDHRCAYCGRGGDLQIEHLIPLARGGEHIPENVVPACPGCNSQKGARTADEYLKRRPVFLAA